MVISGEGGNMGSRYSGSYEEIMALNTLIKLFRASESVSSRTRVVINDSGLSEVDIIEYSMGSI